MRIGRGPRSRAPRCCARPACRPSRPPRRRRPGSGEPRRPCRRWRRPCAASDRRRAPRLPEALAQTCHLRTIDDGSPRTVGLLLADQEFHRVRADVDDRAASGLDTEERCQARWVADVRTLPRGRACTAASRVPGSSDSTAIVFVCRPAARTSVTSALHPSIVYRARFLCTGTGCSAGFGPTAPRRAGAACTPHARRQARESATPPRRPHLSCRHRELGLHRGRPLLEPISADPLAPLDVHQLVANLDGGIASRRQQVELVALLHALHRQRREAILRGAGRLTEQSPLPPPGSRRVEGLGPAARGSRFHAHLSR